jgi:hypothetical protein
MLHTADYLSNGRSLQDFELTIIEQDTVPELDAGKRFWETKMGRHLRDVLERVGLRIDRSSVQESDWGGMWVVTGKILPKTPSLVEPVAVFSGDVVTGNGGFGIGDLGAFGWRGHAAGLLGTAGGLLTVMNTWVLMKTAEEKANEQDSFKPIADETERQVGGLAGSIGGSAAVGFAGGGPVGALVGAAVGGTLGYNAVDSVIQNNTIAEGICDLCTMATPP